MSAAKTHQLTTLHTILSTGSPLKPQSFDYVSTNIKSDVLLGSVTGGTDIIACFAGNNVSLPVYRGEIQSLHLGCAVQSWSEEGMEIQYTVSGDRQINDLLHVFLSSLLLKVFMLPSRTCFPVFAQAVHGSACLSVSVAVSQLQ